MADQKVSALSEVSVPDLTDDLYIVDDTGPTSYKIGTDRLLGLAHILPGGRLTLTSGTAVTTADVTAAGTLYYTPYLHNQIDVYDGTRWRRYAFTERSLSLTLTSGKNYDVFLYDNAGTLTLELSSAWTNDTTRADALTTQDGITVKSGATTRLWLGTIRASGTNTTEDSGGGSTTQVGGKRFVWNAYNRVSRCLVVIDTANTWSYGTNTFRVANGATAPLNCVEYVTGLAGFSVQAIVLVVAYIEHNEAAIVGVGVDGTTPSILRQSGFLSVSGGAVDTPISARLVGYTGLGYHYLAWLETALLGTITFSGDNAADGRQTGLTAVIEA